MAFGGHYLMSIFENETTHSIAGQTQEATIVDAIANWCDCMSGNKPLRNGLRLLAECLGAKAAVLSRVRKDGGHAANTVIFDGTGGAKYGPKLDRSFAEVVLGRYFDKSKSGTLWFSSMLDGSVDPALKSFQRQRCLWETVILPLCTTDRHVDFIELHFTDRLDSDRLGLLNMAASTLVRTWGRRSNGLFVDAALSKTHQTPSVPRDAALLNLTNPAGLSRCEYRVCLLLSNGLNNHAIQEEISITASTLRTHLRHIYAKTECASLAELTFKLLSAPVNRSINAPIPLRIA
jgi:DNA-binding CsgD family transcriptional regulator